MNRMHSLLATILLVTFAAGARSAEPHGELPIPESLVIEHHALHETLARATREPGALGEAARGVEAVLGPHFRREEEIALPPLALLEPLSRGDTSPHAAAVLRMTDALEAELPQMLAEHGNITRALVVLRSAAVTAGRAEYVAFADELRLHARNEEQILYPAALLVGRHLRATAP